MTEHASWENEMKVSPLDSLTRIAKALPTIWKDGFLARRIVRNLPVLPVELDLPSNERIFSWIETLCKTPHRRPGTPEGLTAERWIEKTFKEFGLESVTSDPIPIRVWTAKKWSLEIDGQEVPCFFTVNTGFTGPGGISAPLAYVGAGSTRDFGRVDVAGKIVVAETGFPPMPTGMMMKLLKARYCLSDPRHEMTLVDWQYLNFVRKNFVGGAGSAEEAPEREVYWQAQKRGALGICLILKDQPSGSDSHYGPYDGKMKPVPGLWIGKYEGDRLRLAAKRGISAKLVLDGDLEPGVMHNIWGVLPGMSDETILVTSHHDSPFTGAVEDGSGVAHVLAQAEAWSKVPREKRPRTLVFVTDAGHFYGSEGGHEFARMHADIMRRAKVLITLEHLCGKEVRELGRSYEETGRLALSVIFTSPQKRIIATVIKALESRPVEMTAAIPANLLGPYPTSDAMGYVMESGVPVISWIGCPYYLLDEHDTLDKVDRRKLRAFSETVAEMIKIQMVA